MSELTLLERFLPSMFVSSRTSYATAAAKPMIDVAQEKFKALYDFGTGHVDIPQPLVIKQGDIVDVLSKAAYVRPTDRSVTSAQYWLVVRSYWSARRRLSQQLRGMR